MLKSLTCHGVQSGRNGSSSVGVVVLGVLGGVFGGTFDGVFLSVNDNGTSSHKCCEFSFLRS